jgi:hypothetical protein
MLLLLLLLPVLACPLLILQWLNACALHQSFLDSTRFMIAPT